jgi:hypothetical protein
MAGHRLVQVEELAHTGGLDDGGQLQSPSML